jgi:hypothetical protein
MELLSLPENANYLNREKAVRHWYEEGGSLVGRFDGLCLAGPALGAPKPDLCSVTASRVRAHGLHDHRSVLAARTVADRNFDSGIERCVSRLHRSLPGAA